MSTYGLARLFEPSSVALVGGSPRERSLGRKVLENLASGGFAGPIFLVNPKHPEIDGMASAPNLSALPSSPDLVVITAPGTWPSPQGASISVRPMRPDDEERLQDFLAKIESQDLRLRFFVPVKEFGHAFISRLTQLDYERAIAFVALQKDEIVGVVRLHCDANHDRGNLLSWCDRI